MLAIPVRLEPSIAGNAPVKFAATKLVKFEAAAAGSVDGKRASGIVPDVRLLALKFVKSGCATCAQVRPPVLPD